jgi:hypothetical protein
VSTEELAGAAGNTDEICTFVPIGPPEGASVQISFTEADRRSRAQR